MIRQLVANGQCQGSGAYSSQFESGGAALAALPLDTNQPQLGRKMPTLFCPLLVRQEVWASGWGLNECTSVQ